MQPKKGLICGEKKELQESIMLGTVCDFIQCSFLRF